MNYGAPSSAASSASSPLAHASPFPDILPLSLTYPLSSSSRYTLPLQASLLPPPSRDLPRARSPYSGPFERTASRGSRGIELAELLGYLLGQNARSLGSCFREFWEPIFGRVIRDIPLCVRTSRQLSTWSAWEGASKRLWTFRVWMGGGGSRLFFILRDSGNLIIVEEEGRNYERDN